MFQFLENVILIVTICLIKVRKSSKSLIKWYLHIFYIIMYMFVFKLRTEAFTLGLLTDWLICPHNALKKLSKGGKIILWSNSYKVSDRKSPGQCSLSEHPKLEQLCNCFICHLSPCVFNIFNKSLFPHLQLAPSGFDYAKRKFRISVLIRSFSPDSGLVKVIVVKTAC